MRTEHCDCWGVDGCGWVSVEDNPRLKPQSCGRLRFLGGRHIIGVLHGLLLGKLQIPYRVNVPV
jgi:hypothetical protein